MKVYLSQSDSLVAIDDRLYREWIYSNLKTKVLQLVVPRNYVNFILEAHNSPSGTVILALIKHYRKFIKDFIGLLVKKMLKIGVDLVQFVLQR